MNEKKRLEEVNKIILEIASGNFNNRIEPSGKADEVDVLAAGVNLLGEELKANTVPKSFVEGLYSGVADMMIVLDHHKCIKSINKAVSKALYYYEKELLGHPFSLLLEEGGFKSNSIEEQLADTASPPQELIFRTKSGLNLPVSCSFSSLYSYTSEKADILVFAKDLSYLKHTESLLRKTSQQLYYHIDHSPLAAIQWNGKMEIQSWSWQAENLFGWKEEEVEGKGTTGWNFIIDEDMNKVNERMQLLAQGDELRNVFICRNLSKSGRMIWCEWYNSVIWDENGNLLAIISLVNDISHKKVTDTARKEGQEEERQRIAREIHDGIGQMLISLKFQIDHLQNIGISEYTPKLDELENLVRKTIEEARNITSDMKRTGQSELGIENPIRQLCGQIRKVYGLYVQFDCIIQQPITDPEIVHTLYRISQESLNNIVKHAQATKVIVQLIQSDKSVSLKISDDGRGFKVDTMGQYRGNGLNNIKERVIQHKGRFQVTSSKNKGSLLIVNIPLQPSPEGAD